MLGQNRKYKNRSDDRNKNKKSRKTEIQWEYIAKSETSFYTLPIENFKMIRNVLRNQTRLNDARNIYVYYMYICPGNRISIVARGLCEKAMCLEHFYI